VQHVLGGEDRFDDEMLDGMKTTLAEDQSCRRKRKVKGVAPEETDAGMAFATSVAGMLASIAIPGSRPGFGTRIS
jgi:hypothetical protein